MNNAELHARRAGFTMLEIIVVMGIIAILAAVMMPMLRGTRESALTTQCKNNMRNLAQAVLARAQTNDEGYFPSAGYYRFPKGADLKEKKPYYHPHLPWINNKGDIDTLNHKSTTKYNGTVPSFADSDNETNEAITNGVIWRAVGSSYEVYRCPVHASNFKKVKGYLPRWSYMMNQEFGFSRGGDGLGRFAGVALGSSISVATDPGGTRTKTANRSPDKVLLFAEVQGSDVEDTKNGISLKTVVSGSTETDTVLNYTMEDMGFTHPLGKGKYGGNVAFADGHVDTIVMPVNGMNRRDLTRYFCQGFDAPHDGRMYTPNATDE